MGIRTDVSDEGSVKSAFETIEKGVFGGTEGRGDLAAAVFNVGGGYLRKPFLELTREEFEGGWKGNG